MLIPAPVFRPKRPRRESRRQAKLINWPAEYLPGNGDQFRLWKEFVLDAHQYNRVRERLQFSSIPSEPAGFHLRSFDNNRPGLPALALHAYIIIIINCCKDKEATYENIRNRRRRHVGALPRWAGKCG
jgi:hypothetical protein